MPKKLRSNTDTNGSAASKRFPGFGPFNIKNSKTPKIRTNLTEKAKLTLDLIKQPSVEPFRDRNSLSGKMFRTKFELLRDDRRWFEKRETSSVRKF